MTVEEIEIIVTAKVEEALKEFIKMAPAIREQLKQAQEAFSKVDTKAMTDKVHQAVQLIKKKMQNLRKSSQNNEIAIKVNNTDAQKQISQIQKQIDSLQEKINSRQIKLDITNDTLDKTRNDTNQSVIKDMPEAGNKAIKKETYNRLDKNINYNSLIKESDKLNNEISRYNDLLETAKAKMAQLNQQTIQVSTTQSKLSSFFGAFKQKIEQIKPSISNMKNSFSQMPKITQNITNNIKGIGSGLKQGVGHILKYATTLLSLKGIYSILSNCANTWLSSQNASAKQLSTNIDYMKYAMGSALAPVIQFVTNLVYQLMKAIQSVAYALTGVNIFAKTSAKSYASMAGSAKKAKQETKQLAGVHDEINNISDNKDANSGSGNGGGVAPSFDLSKVNPTNSILDAIKNGNWYEVGAMLGQKLNEAMSNIPWGKIQDGARKIAINIGNFVNGFVNTLDWNLLGYSIGQGINTAFIFANTLLTTIDWGKIGSSVANFLNSTISTINWTLIGTTFANGLNTIIYFGYSFVTTFNWQQFGVAIGNSINGFFQNVDWATAGQTLGEGIKGVFNTISSFLATVDWSAIGESIKTFIQNIDWVGIWNEVKETIKSAIGAVDGILTGLFGENTTTIIEGIVTAIGSVILAIKGMAIIKTIISSISTVFSLLTSPIGLVIIAITALVMAGIYLYKNFETVRDIVSKAIQTISDTFTMLWEEHLKPCLDNIIELFRVLWEDMLEPLIAWFVENVLPVLVPIFESLWKTISSVVGSIIDVISGVIKVLTGIIQFIVGIFTGNWNKAWEGIKKFFSGIWDTIKAIVSTVWNAISGIIMTAINTIKGIVVSIFNAIATVISNIWNGIVSSISNVWNTIVTKVKEGVSGAWNAITSVFGNIGNWFKDKFSQAWKAVKNVFSTGGAIFDGIKDGILNGLKTIVNAIIRGINRVISIPFNGINSALRAIKSVDIMGLRPFSWINTIGVPQIPQLAKGGVLYDDTIVRAGEYSGASSNPEIITPQNIMEETFDKVMSRYQCNSNSEATGLEKIEIHFGSNKVAYEIANLLNQAKRRNGKAIIEF